MIRLRQLGIRFSALPEVKGVLTPVRVDGPIGGVVFRPMGRRRLVCDCRLALALYRAAPVLRAAGVEEMHYSNAYSYRKRRDGRLSQHAMGLAIDVHRLVVQGRRLTVQEDFLAGRDDGQGACDPGLPPLNQVSCRLKQAGAFDWVLTPDTNAAHRNHFHLDIYALHRRKFVAKEVQPPPLAD